MAEARHDWDAAVLRLGRRAPGELQGAIDVLLNVPWPSPSITKEDAGTMLAALADAWRTEVPGQASRVCALVIRFADKGQAVLSATQVDAVLGMLTSLVRARDPFVTLGALRALVCVLSDSGGRSRVAEAVFDSVAPRCRHPPAATTGVEADMVRAATTALGNLFVKPSAKLAPHAGAAFDLLHRNFLRFQEEAKREAGAAKLLAATLRALQQLVAEASGAKSAPVLPGLQLHFNEFVGQLRALMFFGGPLAPIAWHATAEEKSAKRRTAAAAAASAATSTDHSDSSADEASRSEAESKGWKVRANALGCLQALARSCPKQLYNHWSTFLPADAATASAPPAPSLASGTLFTVLQSEEASKVRAACLSALIALLDNSRTFWLAADETAAGAGPRTFISYAATLVAIVRGVHTGLWRVLDTEATTPCLCLALKALALLAVNAPYEKLGAGLVSATAQRLWGTGPAAGLIDHAHLSVRVGALACLAALLQTRTPLPEVATFAGDAGFLPRLLLLCAETQNASLRAEALSCIAALPRHYFAVLWPHCTKGFVHATLLPALFFAADAQLRHAAARVVEEVTAGANARPEPEQLAFWREILESRWSAVLDDAAHPVRCSACNSFGSLTAGVYSALPRPLQVQCLTLVLSKASTDAVASVRAAAARALGTFVLFGGLKDDPVFLSDAALQLLASLNDDQNLNVKVRAAWALANLSDALVSEKEGANAEIEEELAADVLRQLLDSCMRAAGEHDKIRANAVRALGNLARFASARFLLPQFNQLLALLIRNLNQGSAKVRWNACYALGNVLRNSALIDAAPQRDWVRNVLDALCGVLAEGKNFKIRINAANALACLAQRSRYESASFVRVVQTVVQALASLDRVADVNEFQYKQTLTNQLVATLTHLLTIAEAEDARLLATVLKKEKESLIVILEREDKRLEKAPRDGALWAKLAAVYAAIGSPL